MKIKMKNSLSKTQRFLNKRKQKDNWNFKNNKKNFKKNNQLKNLEKTLNNLIKVNNRFSSPLLSNFNN